VTSTREFTAAVAGPIGSLGGSFYFAPSTVATGKEHGLDGFRFYFLGRGGVLGDVEAAVVASAFGYFHPAIVERMWTSAREKMAPRDAGRLYLECGHAFARERLEDVKGLDEFCAAAETVNAAIDPGGLALYSAVAAEPLPDDAPARALHLVTVLREARGSTHLLAVRACGLSPRAAHQIKRPDDVKTFGWQDLDVTDEDRARHARAEELTDELMEPAFAALDDEGRDELATGLDRIGAALA
jgi:hypothetical protein